jgi:hypothetical protein
MKTGHLSDALCVQRVRHVSLAVAVAATLVTSVGSAGDREVADSEWRVLIVAANDPVDRLVPPPLPGPGDPDVVADAAPAGDQKVSLLAAVDDSDVVISPAGEPLAVNGRTYDEVYRSIPYSHTEYLANPEYRHEATMEILFGQLRPTTVHKQSEPRTIVNVPPSPYQPYIYSHYDYWHYRAPAFRLLNPGHCW